MKTILVDAIEGLIFKDGTVFEDMYRLLESYPNPKIALTGANDEQYKEFHLERVPYELFTLKHNPEKSDPQYFKTMLAKYDLRPEQVVLFEHNQAASESARSVGIVTYFYDHKTKDLAALKKFLDDNSQ
jgi:HAD superfamily hydrolase (TIGR01509 family)